MNPISSTASRKWLAGFVLVSAAWGTVEVSAAGAEKKASEKPGAAAAVASTSSVVTYTAPDGQSYFALALRPTGKVPAKSGPHDHIVIVDTSASQMGEHRAQALGVVRALVQAIDPADRICLVASDVQVNDLTRGFVAADSAEMKNALQRLTRRVPLGASNLLTALEQVLDQFEGDRPRSVIYIGDGMSTAKLIPVQEMRELVANYRTAHTPIHAYAIGPRTDLLTLGVLAEHTGGLVLVDDGMEVKNRARYMPEPAAIARQLAAAASQPIIEASTITVDPDVERLLPGELPPLRFDRETILLGKGPIDGPLTVKLSGQLNGRPVRYQWNVTNRIDQAGNTVVASLWARAESDGGLSVPLPGMKMLNLAREAYVRQIDQLENLGEQALAKQNLRDATQIAQGLQQLDPRNEKARELFRESRKGAADRPLAFARQAEAGTETAEEPEPGTDPADEPADEPAGSEPTEETVPGEEPAGEEPAGEEPAGEEPADEPADPEAVPGGDDAEMEAEPAEEADAEEGEMEAEPAAEEEAEMEAEPADAAGPSLLDDFEETDTRRPAASQSLLETRERLLQIRTEQLTHEVNNLIDAIRRVSATEPDAALDTLKRQLNTVVSASDIDPEIRAQLRTRLDNLRLEILSKKDTLDQARQQLARRQALAESQRRLLDQLQLDNERMEQLIDRVRALMADGFRGDPNAFEEAESVARAALSVRPTGIEATADVFNSEAAGQMEKAFRMRAIRADKFLETLYQVELSHVPFPDEPPILWPAPEVWKALTERRRKWASVDLKTFNPTEERIRAALDEPTEVEFIDLPLQDCLNFLKDFHNIEIVVMKADLEAEGVETDTPINLTLSGISLRSALKLMFEGHGLPIKYVIEDEVLKITTEAYAGAARTTRVYPVGDLVIPIQSQSLGMGVGGLTGGGGLNGGNGGSPFGSSGGGLGGGGGGFGGGGFGGGGFMNVPPDEQFAQATSDETPKLNSQTLRDRKKKLIPCW